MIIKTKVTYDPEGDYYKGICKDFDIEIIASSFEECKKELKEELNVRFAEDFCNGKTTFKLVEEVGCNVNFEVLPKKNRSLDEFEQPESVLSGALDIGGEKQ